MLEERLVKYPVELYASMLMPNLGHLVPRPAENGGMGQLLLWVTATHTQRDHVHDHTLGESDLYQAPFKSRPIEDEACVFRVLAESHASPRRASS